MNAPYRSINLAIVLAALLLCGACAPDAAEAPPLADLAGLPSPAAPGSAEPNLFAAGDAVYLSWLAPQPDSTYALRFARLEGEQWSEPRTIAKGDNFFVNWADFPSVIELPDGSLAAHWLVRSGPSTYAYDVHLARSDDGGATWSEATVPHRDGTQTEHGFVSLFAWPDDQLSAVWLDGRKYAEAEPHEGGGEHGSDAEMTLRYAALAPDGQVTREALLDARTCDCCQTAAALTSAGPIVAYRDRSAGEIRDISVVRATGDGWTNPVPVHADGWKIAACPVNGPAIRADGERVAVAWFTAAQDTPRVRVAFSEDAGGSFGAPARVDDGDPTGRVAAELLPDGSVLVAWLERVGEGAEVRVRRVYPDGTRSGSETVAESSTARASGFPQMALAGDRVIFAWTRTGDPAGIEVAAATIRR